MQNAKHKKGSLSTAWKKAALGLAVLTTVSIGLPAVASAQSLPQAQAQMQMANCNANYTNEETNLRRSSYDNWAQRSARNQQITAEYNLCVARVRANYGYDDAQPGYPQQPQPYYPQPQISGNDVTGAIIGTIGGIVLGHELHQLERGGHRWGDHRSHGHGRR